MTLCDRRTRSAPSSPCRRRPTPSAHPQNAHQASRGCPEERRGAHKRTLLRRKRRTLCPGAYPRSPALVTALTNLNSVSVLPRPPLPPPPRSRCVFCTLCFLEPPLNPTCQSFATSRAALASATALTVGSIAWYANLYGTLPFIGEVHANSPAEEGLHPPHYPWSHSGLLDSFDHAR